MCELLRDCALFKSCVIANIFTPTHTPTRSILHNPQDGQIEHTHQMLLVTYTYLSDVISHIQMLLVTYTYISDDISHIHIFSRCYWSHTHIYQMLLVTYTYLPDVIGHIHIFSRCYCGCSEMLVFLAPTVQ